MNQHTTLLLIGDQKTDRARLRALLEADYVLLEAKRRPQALTLLREHPEIALVILDVLLPPGETLAILEALRATTTLTRLPALLCLEPGDGEGQARALELGFADYVVRPWNSRVLLRRIRGLLAAVNEEASQDPCCGLAALERRYREALLSNTLYAYVQDPSTGQRELLHASPEAAKLYHPFECYTYSPEGRPFFRPTDWPRLKRFLASPPPFLPSILRRVRQELQVQIKNRKDGWSWAEITVHPLGEGPDAKLLVTLRLVDRQKRLEEALRQQADTDPLSALLNRRAAQERITSLLDSTPKTCFAFYLLDIDNFKLVNDTFGHCAGDAVILGVADALRQSFRVSDLVARLGGDEFGVFMPCTGDEALLRQKASSALRAIGRLSFPKYPDLKLSVSMGVSLYPRDGDGFEPLYQHADKALYQMKDSGKNGYAFYGDEKSKA